MTSVPALMMVGGAILGCAWARPGAIVNAEAAAPAFNRLRRRILISVMSVPQSVPPIECKFDAEPRPCPGPIQATPHQPTITAAATFTARR